MNGGFGRGFGRGQGGPSTRFGAGGRGWRNMYFATGLPGWIQTPTAPAPEQELAALKQQADNFGKALEDIQGRIRKLESKPADQ